jgi:hypothetical protein
MSGRDERRLEAPAGLIAGMLATAVFRLAEMLGGDLDFRPLAA